MTKNEWKPMGYALGNDTSHIHDKFKAEHPGFVGDLKIGLPDKWGFRKLEFRGQMPIVIREGAV